MNSRTIQIIAGIFVSIILLSAGILGGAYYTGLIGDQNMSEEEPDNKSEVKVIEPNDYSTVSQDAINSVVSIYSESDGGLSSQGSGFMYKDNYIMTNHHVIESADNVLIKYSNGEWTNATVIGSDVYTDIAVLEPDNIPDNVETLDMMETALPERGVPVLALGSPGDLGGTVTTGIISGTDRTMQTQTEFTVPDSVQTDAALNPGNSGGPLISAENGTVFGVNTATEGENLGFAVSSRLANTIGESLIETGNHSHSYVGIRTLELTPLTESNYDVGVDSGLVVSEVVSESPNYGVLRGENTNETPDVIVSIEGKEIDTNQEMTSYLMRKTQPGDTVEVGVYRNGTVQNIQIELGSR